MDKNGEKKIGVKVMIFFPNLYKDELLFSVLARSYQYSGDENKKHFIYDLFDSSTTCASTIFPANIEKLCENLPFPNAYSSNYFINNHTLLPYYSPFMTNDRENKLRLIMKKEDGTKIFMNSGRAASTVKNEKKLKYCLLCVDEERETKGESYWHRTHQIEGVKVCPIHKTWLIESSTPFTERKHKHEFISLEDSIRNSDLISIDTNLEIEFEHFLYVAEQTDYLLNNSIKPLGLENLRNFYISKLNEQQLVTLEGRVRWKQLIPKFNEYYGKQLLDTLESFIHPDGIDTWLHKLLRKPRVGCHPLRHILFLGFLGETISSMVNQIDSISYKPFGDGPWICLNKASEHYQKPILNSCVISRDYKTGLPIGTFSCSCGFIFSRRGPDKTNEDRYKIGRIKEFGRVWEDKLAELEQKKLSLRKMAKLLGVDPKTIKRKLIRRVDQQINITPNDNTIKIKNYRREWAILLKNNVDKTITELRAISPKLYTWLYRNDGEWLKDNYPSSEQRNKPLNGLVRVDWKKRDEEIAMKVESIVYTILSEKNNLTRVTKNEIGRRLGKLAWFLKYLDQLPKTLVIVNKSIETVEQFQIRRIKNVVGELRKTNASIKEWKVIRAAGLKKEFAQSLKEVITNELNSYPMKQENSYAEDIRE
jgi:hypothetical protein